MIGQDAFTLAHLGGQRGKWPLAKRILSWEASRHFKVPDCRGPGRVDGVLVFDREQNVVQSTVVSLNRGDSDSADLRAHMDITKKNRGPRQIVCQIPGKDPPLYH